MLSSLRQATSRAWKASFGKHLLLTNCVSCSGFFMLGDAIQQRLEMAQTPGRQFDLRRSLRLGLVGLSQVITKLYSRLILILPLCRVPRTTTGTCIWINCCRENPKQWSLKRFWQTRLWQLPSLLSPSSMELVYSRATHCESAGLSLNSSSPQFICSIGCSGLPRRRVTSCTCHQSTGIV